MGLCCQRRGRARDHAAGAFPVGPRPESQAGRADLGQEYKEALKDYLALHLNNVGDPFQRGNCTINSKWLERAVLDYYAAPWNARANLGEHPRPRLLLGDERDPACQEPMPA